MTVTFRQRHAVPALWGCAERDPPKCVWVRQSQYSLHLHAAVYALNIADNPRQHCHTTHRSRLCYHPCQVPRRVVTHVADTRVCAGTKGCNPDMTTSVVWHQADGLAESIQQR